MMKKMMTTITTFLKKETVLCVALVLAAVSTVLVPPDKAYLGYIDFRTLAILFCLMSVMADCSGSACSRRLPGSSSDM